MSGLFYNGKKMHVTGITESYSQGGGLKYEFSAIPENTLNFRFAEYVELPKIEKVIFNEPATIVFWKDGTKTIVKCSPNDEYDREKGLLMCIAKKLYKGKAVDMLRKWCR